MVAIAEEPNHEKAVAAKTWIRDTIDGGPVRRVAITDGDGEGFGVQRVRSIAEAIEMSRPDAATMAIQERNAGLICVEQAGS